MKIWAKTVVEEKITRDLLYQSQQVLTLEQYLQDICHQMDIPTPILSATLEGYFDQFNHVKFRAEHFVESVDFDFFEIEHCISK